MADVKYKDATPVDEPVARPKQKAKPTPPKQGKKLRYTETTGFKPNDSEELKSSPVAGLDLTESEPNPYNMEPSSYAKGGSASSRGDGIAQRGKTRGMMVMCGGGMAKGKK
jgi:hypothetical protein